MPEYYNHNSFTVYMPGPDGRLVELKSRQKRILPDFFERYRSRGLIKLAAEAKNSASRALYKQLQAKQLQAKHNISKTSTRITNDREVNKKTRQQVKENLERKRVRQKQIPVKNSIVGKTVNADANKLLRNNLESVTYPISNNIGVGILSYNRANSLRRCIDSILKHTDLDKTTVFISDDGSDDDKTLRLLDGLEKYKNITILRNIERIGIGGNSNRLLRCMSRFKYGILLNDDVEILKDGWEYFYPKVMEELNFKHFIYRQPGVYGAEKGQPYAINGINLLRTEEKPHGAILAYTSEMHKEIGYFDERYGEYGMEHVDWSTRVYEHNLQPKGYFDVYGSDSYFKIHAEPSSVADKSNKLKKAKDIFKHRTSAYVEATDRTKVDHVTYVIPYRNMNRNDDISTVISNIRSQRFPSIDIVVVEQDIRTQLNIGSNLPINYNLVTDDGNKPFNKAKAFNRGVQIASGELIVLHDADMLIDGMYTSKIHEILKNYEACHIGKTVIYADKESSSVINASRKVNDKVNCDRIVGYYEGGSLACRKSAYWKCGGFNEDYYGYGCEDCDFFARISKNASWFGERSISMLHLWHDRAEGWDKHHIENKRIEESLNRLSIQERINRQLIQLERNGYVKR